MSEKKYISEETKFRDKMMDILEKELPEYCRSFFMAANHNMQSKTRYAYAIDLGTFFYFLTQTNSICKSKKTTNVEIDILEALDPDDIDEYLTWVESYDRLDEDGTTRHYTNTYSGKARKLACLKSFYKFMNKRKKIRNNPVAIIDTPSKRKQDKEIITFKDDEIKRFLDHILYGKLSTEKQQQFQEKTRLRDYAIFMTLFGTGLRISELTGLDIDTININEGCCYVHRKGGNNQMVFFGDEVKGAIEEYLSCGRELFKPSDDENAVFLSTQGTRMTDRAIEKRLKRYADEVFGAGNNFTPHKCRATYGTKIYNETGDIYLVSESLGHSDISTTTKYYSKMSDEKRKSVAKIKIKHED